MDSPSTARPATPTWGLSSCLLLGVLAGLCHAVGEGTLLGWYGVRMSTQDVLMFTLLYGGAGLLYGLFVLAVLRLVRALKVVREPDDSVVFLSLTTLAYAVISIVRIVQETSGLTALGLSVGASFGLALTLSIAYRRRRASGTTAFALLGLSFCAVGSTLLAAQSYEITDSSAYWLLGLSLCVMPAAMIGLMLIAAAPTSSSRPGLRSAALCLTFFVVHLILTFAVWPTTIKWHMDHPSDPPSGPIPDSPNVILVVLDTVRAQNLDLFGYSRETMPFLTSFANTEADYAAPMLANAAETLPSHASMFTGHFVYSHGAHKPFLVETDVSPVYLHPLDDTYPTLAGWLTEHGYRTGAIAANTGQVAGYGLERGFQDFDCIESNAAVGRSVAWLFSLTVDRRSAGVILARRLPKSLTPDYSFFNLNVPGYRKAADINDQALRWLDADHRPFFLFLNYLDAHDPYLPPPEFRKRFVSEDDEVDWVGFPFQQWRAALFEGAPMPEKDIVHARALYDAELAYLDSELERLFTQLRQRWFYENTLILLVGDHGEEFWEHGALLHGGDVYDTQVRVPFIVKLPEGVDPVSVAPTPSMQPVDFFSSVASVLELTPPPDLQGSPWGHDRDYAMAENFVHWGRGSRYHRQLVAVEMNGLKYIRSTTGEEELYDGSHDPSETSNLIGSHPDLAKPMRLVADERDETLRVLIPRQLVGSGAETDERLEKLRALGYID